MNLKKLTLSLKGVFLISLISVLLLLAGNPLKGQDKTEGEVTFSVTTSTTGKRYAPRHVLAIWIEDSNGFVITKKLRASKRKEYLYTWNKQSSGNTVDAITGSTLSSHQAHSVTWDCKDIQGNTVPDGEYKIFAEFTEEHAQGPLFSQSFNKGATNVNLSPSNTSNFKNISLVYTPSIPAEPDAAFGYIVDGLTVTFTNSSSNATSYTWDFGDGNSSTEVNPVHVYAAADTYLVLLIASGEGGTDTTTNEVTVVDAPVAPEADFNFSVDGMTVTFSNSSSNSSEYAWNFGDGESSSEVNPVHIYANADTYQVVLIASGTGGLDTIEQNVTVDDVTGLNATSLQPEFSVYPNPSSDKLHLRANKDQLIIGYCVYNLSGKLERQKSISPVHSLVIDMQTWENGVYFLKIFSDDHEEASRMILKE